MLARIPFSGHCGLAGGPQASTKERTDIDIGCPWQRPLSKQAAQAVVEHVILVFNIVRQRKGLIVQKCGNIQHHFGAGSATMLTTLASQGEGFDDFGAQFGDLGRPLETSGAALGSVVVFVSVVGGICMSMGWFWSQFWHLFMTFWGVGALKWQRRT